MSSSTTRITGTPMASVSCSTLRLSSMYLTMEIRMRALPCHRKMRSMPVCGLRARKFLISR